MLIPSVVVVGIKPSTSLSRRVNANSQRVYEQYRNVFKLIKKGEC